jgi:hypothetical protein
MSVSAVNAVITYGAAPPADRYTVPAGKVVVVNVFCASKGFNAGTFLGSLGINGTNFVLVQSPTEVGPHCGPFVFNSGDVLTLPTGARGGAPSVGNANPNPDGSYTAITPKLGIVGESYDAMPNIKVPFGAALVESSTNYTVPGGKIARFMMFIGGPLVGGGSRPCLAINGVDIAIISDPGGVANITQFFVPVGPLIAGPGSVLSVTSSAAPSPFPGSCYINGWLYNTVP